MGNIDEVKHENKGIWIVLDEDGFPIYCAGWPEACHEHINEAINDFAIVGAARWRVRRAELVPNVEGKGLAAMCPTKEMRRANHSWQTKPLSASPA